MLCMDFTPKFVLQSTNLKCDLHHNIQLICCGLNNVTKRDKYIHTVNYQGDITEQDGVNF